MASTGTIHGIVVHNDGTPVKNVRVWAYPSVRVIRDSAANTLRIDNVSAVTSATGAYSMTVTASDDLTLDPSGVTWTVAQPGVDPVPGVFVPAGGTVEMARVTPVDPAAPRYAAQVSRDDLTAETTARVAGDALALAKASNLSDLPSAPTARTNLGLGTAATHAHTDYDASGAAAAAQTAAAADAASKVAVETTRAQTAEAAKVDSSAYTTGQATQDAATDAIRNLTDATHNAALSASYGAARALVRNPFPLAPADIGTMLTPAPQPYQESDGLLGCVGWDRSWLMFGEDVQLHAVSKRNLSSYRMDRSPNWLAAAVGDDGQAWYVAVSDYVTTPTGVSPNSFLYGAAREAWTFTDAATGATVETGYAIVVGTGDKSGSVYRPPTVLFCREGAKAAQALTAMLDTAGIMGGSYATPKSLMGVVRAAADTFYLYGSGENASTNPDTERPTFGQMVLTLNSSKTETGASAVSSLTWTDRLSVLQGAVTASFASETIVNVAAVSDKLVGTKLLVLVITKQGLTLRGRMVEFDTSNATATLDTKVNAATAAAVWPLTPQTDQRVQTASITVGNNGILFTLCGAGGAHHAYYRGTAETTWRNVLQQAGRAMGVNVAAPFQVRWDGHRSQFLISSSSKDAGIGWLDANCKQGHFLSRLFPWQERINGRPRLLRGVWGDATGIVANGSHQLAAFFPDRGDTPPGSRVVWGCRVTGTAAWDAIHVSEGEVEVVNSSGVTRLYVPAQDYSSGLGDLGDARFPHTIIARLNGGNVVILRPLDSGGSYVGAASGDDYPEPASHLEVILALVDRVNANSQPITSAEILMDSPNHREV